MGLCEEERKQDLADIVRKVEAEVVRVVAGNLLEE